MPNIKSTYQRPSYLFNAHLETIIPAISRRVKLQYERERIDTPDGDFLDLDWCRDKQARRKRLVIVSHGLEGSSERAYAKGLSRIFWQNGWETIAWNHRGCSGEPNRLKRFYHSGASEDLRAVVNHALQAHNYDSIVLTGFSLGGNMTLKYLGEEGKNIHSKIKRAVVFSVPLHLSSCSESLRQPHNWIYAQRFKQHLRHKIKRKAQIMPEAISLEPLKKVRTLKDFDNLYTAPLHGFADAEDYYERSSALYFLEQISLPTLIVNAQNDPFLAPPCFPYDLTEKLDNIYFETPKTGGHCGFSPANRQGYYWSERRALAFAEEQL